MKGNARGRGRQLETVHMKQMKRDMWQYGGKNEKGDVEQRDGRLNADARLNDHRRIPLKRTYKAPSDQKLEHSQRSSAEVFSPF